MSSSIEAPRRKFAGLFVQRMRWGLSRRGWIGLALLLAALAGGIFFGIYPFLAVNQRVETRLLAVEGWIDLHAIGVAAKEFNLGSYDRVFTTGGPVHGMGGYTNDYNTSASVGAGRLRQAGVPADKVQMTPSRVAARDRTYSAALALRRWCEENKVALTSINVLTEDVHARRTRLLFQMALGPTVKVGIIAVPNADYDTRRWWRYSEGVRAVLGETIAYVYARFFFFP